MPMPDSSIFNRRHYTKATLPPLQAEPLPGWCYASPAFHQREIDRVLSRSWICLGRENALPNTGDYRTIELYGARLIVIRDQTGTIRVLNNVCRHRGMVLLEGSGNVPAISCPFHAWAYGLDGSYSTRVVRRLLNGKVDAEGLTITLEKSNRGRSQLTGAVNGGGPLLKLRTGFRPSSLVKRPLSSEPGDDRLTSRRWSPVVLMILSLNSISV